ncbi:MAG: hypothetical protein IPN71_17455 [Fibrobacteres bacterium]|jgi:hypothetical protein|nr:hypothetical protein [Fibrobacterota bacterium]
MIHALLLAFFSTTGGLSLHPELECSGSLSDRGGYQFRYEAWSRYNGKNVAETKSGTVEKVVRGGASIHMPLGETWEMVVGSHIGYSWALAEGGARLTGSEEWVGQRIRMDYCLADLQFGVRWKPWRHLGFLTNLVLEEGLFGTFEWTDFDGSKIASGEFGSTRSYYMGFPLKVYLKVGPEIHFLDRFAVSPWLGFGYAPVMTATSHLSTGGFPGYPHWFGEEGEESLLSGKMGILASFEI